MAAGASGGIIYELVTVVFGTRKPVGMRELLMTARASRKRKRSSRNRFSLFVANDTVPARVLRFQISRAVGLLVTESLNMRKTVMTLGTRAGRDLRTGLADRRRHGPRVRVLVARQAFCRISSFIGRPKESPAMNGSRFHELFIVRKSPVT